VREKYTKNTKFIIAKIYIFTYNLKLTCEKLNLKKSDLTFELDLFKTKKKKHFKKELKKNIYM
jgi:hypothetical protein